MEEVSLRHVSKDPFAGPLTAFDLDAHSDVVDTPLEPRESLGAMSSDQESSDDSKVVVEGSDIDLCRRVIPALEEDQPCCSICLDEYSTDDPSIATTCGHGYHLQCIMQWAQRSRECPLCFHALHLENEDMNALLPFGEYVDPQQQAASASMLETWDLERLLLQIATNESRERRAHRRRARATVNAGERVATSPMAINQVNRVVCNQADQYPASWPPSSSGADRREVQQEAEGDHIPVGRDDSNPESRGSAQSAQSLGARLALLRLRDSFNKTTKELKSFFSPTSTGRTHH